jgi:hypothetical protein
MHAEATTCPHCRERSDPAGATILPEPKSTGSKIGRVFGFGCLGLVGLVVALWIIGSLMMAAKSPPASGKIDYADRWKKTTEAHRDPANSSRLITGLCPKGFDVVDLPEADRKAIVRVIGEAEDRANAEAMSQVSPKQSKELYELRTDLMKKYGGDAERQVAAQYHLSIDTVRKIETEGVCRDWYGEIPERPFRAESRPGRDAGSVAPRREQPKPLPEFSDHVVECMRVFLETRRWVGTCADDYNREGLAYGQAWLGRERGVYDVPVPPAPKVKPQSTPPSLSKLKSSSSPPSTATTPTAASWGRRFSTQCTKNTAEDLDAMFVRLADDVRRHGGAATPEAFVGLLESLLKTPAARDAVKRDGDCLRFSSHLYAVQRAKAEQR